MSKAPQKNEDTWTVLKILEWTTSFFSDKGSPSARLDAELLLSELLKLERIHLYTNFDRPLTQVELDAYRALVKRRAQGEPIAYILGHREFWTLDLEVSPAVLIPRPDTETLVQAALDRIPKEKNWKVLDIGTGSGAIALSIASERPSLSMIATDISPEALAMARKNAENHDLAEMVDFMESDLFKNLDELKNSLDMIVTNPPYIGESEREDMGPGVAKYEPSSALFAGDDGLQILKTLIPASLGYLKDGGFLLTEIGYKQGEDVKKLFQETGFQNIEILQDFGQRDRVVLGQIERVRS